MKKLLLFIMMIVCVGLQAQQIEDLRRKAEDGKRSHESAKAK